MYSEPVAGLLKDASAGQQCFPELGSCVQVPFLQVQHKVRAYLVIIAKDVFGLAVGNLVVLEPGPDPLDLAREFPDRKGKARDK